jgi:hypothetical protein
VSGSDPATIQPVAHPVPAILAGLVIDLLDLSLAGPLGIAGALVAGTLVWWLTQTRALSSAARWSLIAAVVLYCVLPLTELVPLGTLVGAGISIADWRASKKNR